MSETSHNYELAYHIKSDYDESKLLDFKTLIEDLIVKNKGTVTFSREPSKTRLSYEIDHSRMSFFGFIHFNTEDPEILTHLNEQLKLNNDILRYLIIKLPSEKERNKALIKQQKAKERIGKKEITRQPAKENVKIDEQLENIIENL